MCNTILYKKDRNYDVEELGIKMLAKRVKSCITEDDIRNTLIKNGFNGIYMLSSDEFYQLKDDNNVRAYYAPLASKIIVNSDYYKNHKDIVVHELVHAYLNCKANSLVNINDEDLYYGRGLEEGCCSIIQNVNSIDNIDDCIVNGYHYQTHLIKQLNVLYKYSSSKKYSNLLHHLLIEPDDFIPSIARIYESILNKLDIDVSDVGLKTALAMVICTDSMLEDKQYDFSEFYKIINSINTIYLFLENKKIRDKNLSHPLFATFKPAIKLDEDRLLELLLGTEKHYFERQVELLSKLLIMFQEEIEKYSEYRMSDYNCLDKVKKKC